MKLLSKNTMLMLSVATLSLTLSSCITTNTADGIGKVVGTGVGAGAGYLMGKNSGHGAEGATVGAFAGFSTLGPMISKRLSGDGRINRIQKRY